MKARLSNVPIRDLLITLTGLALRYDIIDIIVDADRKTIIIEPITRVEDDSELTDDNIYKLI